MFWDHLRLIVREINVKCKYLTSSTTERTFIKFFFLFFFYRLQAMKIIFTSLQFVLNLITILSLSLSYVIHEAIYLFIYLLNYSFLYLFTYFAFGNFLYVFIWLCNFLNDPMHDFGNSVQGFENSDLHIFVFGRKIFESG